jgi:hypothetical protein
MSIKKTKTRNKELNLSPQDPAAAALNRPNFYARVLKEAEALDFAEATGTEGLDSEIALLRVKIKTLLAAEPQDLKLIAMVSEVLIKMVKARYCMNKKQEKNLGEAVKNIIRDIGVPLGVAALNKKL